MKKLFFVIISIVTLKYLNLLLYIYALDSLFYGYIYINKLQQPTYTLGQKRTIDIRLGFRILSVSLLDNLLSN